MSKQQTWRLMMQGGYVREGWGFAHHYKEPSVTDLVEALLEQGAESVHTFDSPIPELGGSIPTIEVHRPGRYLIFRIEEEENNSEERALSSLLSFSQVRAALAVLDGDDVRELSRHTVAGFPSAVAVLAAAARAWLDLGRRRHPMSG
jgi:hypothetical protein